MSHISGIRPQDIEMPGENLSWYGEGASAPRIYTYVDNDPLNGTDPSGKCYPVCTVLAGIAIAEGAAYLSDPRNFNLKTALVAGGIGLVAGLVPVAATELFGVEAGATNVAINLGTNFSAGAGGSVGGQLANGQPVNVPQALALGAAAVAGPLLSGEAVIAGVGTGLSEAGEAYVGTYLSAASQGITIPLSYGINQAFEPSESASGQTSLGTGSAAPNNGMGSLGNTGK